MEAQNWGVTLGQWCMQKQRLCGASHPRSRSLYGPLVISQSNNRHMIDRMGWDGMGWDGMGIGIHIPGPGTELSILVGNRPAMVGPGPLPMCVE